MSIYYIPYHGKKPAAVVVNGHRLVIMSQDKECLQDELAILGADKVKKIKSEMDVEENLPLIDRISKNAKAGIVFAPREAKITEVIKNLEEQLPWLH